MTRVVVTGASGFVGAFVRASLAARGAQVVAADREARPPRVPTETSIVLTPGDSPAHMADALDGASAVVHLAAAVHDVRGRTSEGEYLAVNRDFPMRLAQAAADVGVARFVFVSTIKVNGQGTLPGGAFDETSAVAPDGAYADSKRQAEDRLGELSAERGIELRIVRPPLVYGAGVRANFRSLMRSVKRGIPLPFAGFKNRRSLIYVENLADVLAQVTLSAGSAARSRTYLVSDGEDLSTPDLVRGIARAMHVAPRLFNVPEGALRFALAAIGRSGVADRLVGSLQVDASLVRRELGWSPPYRVEDGLARTVAWFMSQP